MAEIIDNEQWANWHGRGVTRYPWEEWFDGQTRIMTRGKDFTSTMETFRNTVSVNAFRNHVRVRTRKLDDDRVMIQAFTGSPATRDPCA